jgi:hypothetical protein
MQSVINEKSTISIKGAYTLDKEKEPEVPGPKNPEPPKHEPELPNTQPGKTNPLPEVPDTEIPNRENPVSPGDPHPEEEPERKIHTSRPDEPQ